MYVLNSSGIPEALNSMFGETGRAVIFISIIVVAVVCLVFVWILIDKALKVRPRDTSTLSAAVSIAVSVTVGVGGVFAFSAHVVQKENVVHERTLKNIQENFDMQDTDVKNIDNYSDQNKSTVYGSSNGRILEFEVGYSAEHDVMMPIVEPEDLNALPVKEGSTLDSVLTTEETVEEDLMQ